MKLSCSQFEGLMTFYIDGDLSESLKKSFEAHLEECPACKMKFQIIHSVIDDIKGAYDKILRENGYEDCYDYESGVVKTQQAESQESENVTEMELSAYMDNELPHEYNVRIRRNIIAKPKIRTKLEKLYKLRKLLSDSFVENKNRLRSDYSKDVVKSIKNEITPKDIYIHCAVFILVVILAVVISVIVILSVL